MHIADAGKSLQNVSVAQSNFQDPTLQSCSPMVPEHALLLSRLLSRSSTATREPVKGPHPTCTLEAS